VVSHAAGGDITRWPRGASTMAPMSKVGATVQARWNYVQDEESNTALRRQYGVSTKLDAAELTMVAVLANHLQLSRSAMIRLLVRTGVHDAFEALSIRAVADHDQEKVLFYALEEAEELEPPAAKVDMETAVAYSEVSAAKQAR